MGDNRDVILCDFVYICYIFFFICPTDSIYDLEFESFNKH